MDKHQIFISYSSVDCEVAMKVCNAIEQTGYGCWIAPRNEQAGLSFGLQITNAIKQSKAVVLLYSESSNKSQHVLNEVSVSFEHQVKIIPFLLDSSVMCEDLQYYLSRLHHINAEAGFDIAVRELLINIRKHIESWANHIVLSTTESTGMPDVELATHLTESLINSSSSMSMAIGRFHDIIKDIPNWTKQERILNKAKEIISYSFVGVIGREFGRIIAITKDDDPQKYKKFFIESKRMIMITLDLSIFSLITRIWDMVDSKRVTLDSKDKERVCKRLNAPYLLSVTEKVDALLALIQVYSKYEGQISLPIPELKNIMSTLAHEGEVYLACESISRFSEQKITPEDCVAIEESLATVLKHFNFFMHYRMASLKWSRYEKPRMDTIRYLHSYVALGMDNNANIDHEKVNQTDSAIATDMVVMYVDKINNEDSINLYPLIIDLNTLHRENGSKICFFYQNPIQDNALEYLLLDDFSTIVLNNRKIKHKVENICDLYSSNENIAKYNIDKVLDTFDQLLYSLSGNVFVDFGDL